MPPDSNYTIHLIYPIDTTYRFDSDTAFRHFVDSTPLLTGIEKEAFLNSATTTDSYTRNLEKQEQDDDIFTSGIMIEVALIAGILLSYLLNRFFTKTAHKAIATPPEAGVHSHFVYKGAELDFDTVTLEIICLKYNTFFRSLQKPRQQLFLERLQTFMQRKQFRMYGADCYREMPVLLSATAVQLCFGLPGFYLDNYPIIVIRPQAYLGYEPLRILTGNVQGNTITVSWEHFLKDQLDAEDGNNVGLHEMAHAFALQLLYAPFRQHPETTNLLHSFYQQLETFIATEQPGPTSLFDTYSLQNPDECWAKCIELFFERGEEIQHFYPELHSGIKAVLNQ